eukprot:gene13373-6185_t
MTVDWSLVGFYATYWACLLVACVRDRFESRAVIAGPDGGSVDGGQAPAPPRPDCPSAEPRPLRICNETRVQHPPRIRPLHTPRVAAVEPAVKLAGLSRQLSLASLASSLPGPGS